MKAIKIIVGILLLATYSALACLSFLIKNEDIVGVLGVIGLAIIAILLIINSIASCILRSKRLKVKEFLDEMINSQQEANDSKKYERKIKIISSLGYLYGIVIIISVHLLAQAVIYFLREEGAMPLLLFTVIEAFITTELIMPRTKDNHPITLNSNDYPFINELVLNVGKKFNITKNIKIVPVASSEIGVYDNSGETVIYVGLIALLLLNEAELEAAMHHEFAHVYNKDTKKMLKLSRRIEKLLAIVNDQNGSTIVVRFLFSPLVFKLQFNYELYKHNSQLEREIIADDTVADMIDRQAYINGICKLQTFETACTLTRSRLYINNVEAPVDYLYQFVNEIKEHININQDKYKGYITKELQIRFPTHPTSKERMDKLSITDFEVVGFAANEKYLDEVNKIIDQYNQEWYNLNKEQYKEMRKNNHENFIKAIDNKKNDEELSSSDAANLGFAYEMTCDKENSMKYYNLAIELDPNNQFALFRIGFNLLCDDNHDGIEYIKKAISLDKDYSENGINFIGAYLARNGLEKERESYRQYSVELTQEKIDYDIDYAINNKSNLVPTTMSYELIEAISSIASKNESILEIKAIDQIIEKSYRHIICVTFKQNYNQEQQIADYNELIVNLASYKNLLFITTSNPYDIVACRAVLRKNPKIIYKSE